MIGILWLVLIVGIAIWQLSIAQGRTELKGNPFENEVRKQKVRPKPAAEPLPRTISPSDVPQDEPKELRPNLEQSNHEEHSLLKPANSLDLMQAIILSEILAPPRAKQTRRRR